MGLIIAVSKKCNSPRRRISIYCRLLIEIYLNVKLGIFKGLGES